MMKDEATVYDVISVVVLMEHTQQTCLFGCELPPKIIFEDAEEYLMAKEAVLYRLGLDR